MAWRWWARGAIALIAFAVALGVLEVIVRVGDPLGVSYYQTSTAYHLDKKPDPDLVFHHAPSWQARYGGVPVTYNEHGLRDRPIPRKSGGEYRILALGDSVTFGWGVAQDETFAARLEAVLSARLVRPIRVINSGVGGYNTVQEVAYFRRDGLALQPDLVVLTYVENDVEVNQGPFDPWRVVAIDGKPPLEAAAALLGKSWLYRLAYYVYHSASSAGRASSAAGPPGTARGWRDSMTALDDLVALCDVRRLPLLIFFFRWSPHAAQPLYADVVRHAAGHPLRDVGRWFAGRDVRALMKSRIDTHPNAEGHRLMAEHMAAEIADQIAPPAAPAP